MNAFINGGHRIRLLLSVMTLGLVTACASSTPSDARSDESIAVAAPEHPVVDKAGNADSAEPVTLTVGWYGGEGRPQAQVVERFAEEVTVASGGSITIEIAYGTADPWADFQAGRFDMLLTPTQSLDTMGVDSFDVLSLPFLVQDDEQADRVAKSPIVADMMAGLSVLDATGLMFAPVYEIHPAVHGDEPLRTLEQLHTGLRLAPPSDRVDQLYRALGATPRYNLNDDAWSAAVDSGEVRAMDYPTSLAFNTPGTLQMAANVVMYYQFVVLLASNDVLGKLDPAQVEMLNTAAATAQERSITERVREDAAFHDACAQGVTLTAAPMTFIADVGIAVDDLIVQMLSDPATKGRYDAVQRAAGAHRLSWPDECHDGSVVRYEPPAPPTTTFPTGTYRMDGRTREQMLVSGVSNQQATQNVFDYTEYSFADGTATLTFSPAPDGASATCSGPYTVDDSGHLVLGTGCGTEGTYTWHEIDGGIALEMMPTDDLLYLRQDWDNTAQGGANMVRVN